MGKKVTMVVSFDIELENDDTSFDGGSHERFDWNYYLDKYSEAYLLRAECHPGDDWL